MMRLGTLRGACNAKLPQRARKAQAKRQLTTAKVAQVTAPPSTGLSAPPQKMYSLEEVSKHRTPDDCWVIIDRQVYDITPWVKKHPGGNLIYVRAGQDCTLLFDSYHMTKAKAGLKRYRIGVLDPQDQLTIYTGQHGDEPFYEDLKQRVAKYFRDNKLNPRFSWAMYIKSAAILVSLGLAQYGAFYYFSNMFAAAGCAVLTGVAMALVGTAIQHDANHGAYSPNGVVNYIMGLTIDLCGVSSYMWKQQHVANHHIYTNVHEMDPDIQVSDPDIMRLNQFQPLYKYHSIQWLYLGLAYGLLALKAKYFADVQKAITQKMGNVQMTGFTKEEAITFWSLKAAYVGWFIICPIAFGVHSLGAVIALQLLAEATMGWVLAFMFQLAHVVEDVHMIEAEENGEAKNVTMGWAESQMATSVDFEQGSPFWTHFSGGLNYQTVHHLFPGIAHTHYPALSPIVEECAAEYGFKYKKSGNIWQAIGSHINYLRSVGNPEPAKTV